MLLQQSAVPIGSTRALVVHRPGGNVIFVLALQRAPHFEELGRVLAATDDRGVLNHEADLVPVWQDMFDVLVAALVRRVVAGRSRTPDGITLRTGLPILLDLGGEMDMDRALSRPR